MTTTINASTTSGLVQTADTSGVLALQTAGTTAVTVNTTQYVGINNTSPSASLDVTGHSASNGYYNFKGYSTGRGYGSYTNSSGTIVGYIGNGGGGSMNTGAVTDFGISSAGNLLFSAGGSLNEQMRIDANGYTLINTTSNPDFYRLLVNGGSSTEVIRALSSSTTGTGVNINNTSSGGYNWNIFSAGSAATVGTAGSLVFRDSTTGATRMTINNSGCVLVGTNVIDAAGTFHYVGRLNAKGSDVEGSSVLSVRYAGTSTFRNVSLENANGQVGYIQTSNSTTTYSTSSDYRLKENVQPMVGALDKVAQLNPVTFTWKVDGTDGQGFIAHELQEHFPDAVGGEKDAVMEDGTPDYQGVDTSFLVATLTKAIQEQQELIKQLQADVAELKGAA